MQPQQALMMARQTEFVSCDQTIYHYLRLWELDGTWEMLNTRLREQVRRQWGREATPSAGVMDSQSAKSTERGDLGAMMAARR
jgi:transposase